MQSTTRVTRTKRSSPKTSSTEHRRRGKRCGAGQPALFCCSWSAAAIARMLNGRLQGLNPMPSKRDHAFAANINLTALVGALLVLLVVFMIAAPLKQVAIPLDLPHGHFDNEQNAILVSLRATEKSSSIPTSPAHHRRPTGRPWQQRCARQVAPTYVAQSTFGPTKTFGTRM